MRRVANYQGTSKNAVMYARPVHFTRGIQYGNKIVCGSNPRVNSLSPSFISITTLSKEVTCKQCLKYLQKYPYATR